MPLHIFPLPPRILLPDALAHYHKMRKIIVVPSIFIYIVVIQATLLPPALPKYLIYHLML